MKKKMCLLLALCLLFLFFTGCNYVIIKSPDFQEGDIWVNEKTGSWFEIKAEYDPYLTGEIIMDGKVYPVALSFWYNDVYFFPAEKSIKTEDGYLLYGNSSLPYFGGKWRLTETTFLVFDIYLWDGSVIYPWQKDQVVDWILPKEMDRMTFVWKN